MARPENYEWVVSSWKMWDQTEYFINHRFCVQITYLAYTPKFYRKLTETTTEKFISLDNAIEYLRNELSKDES